MIKIIDFLNKYMGLVIAWLVLLMVAGTLYNVIARYFFAKYDIQLEELVRIMNAMVFLLAAPLLLQNDKHVRVDVFYARFSAKRRAWVDGLGSLFLLLPLCGFIIYYSWKTVITSWSLNEASSQTGGLPALYLVKTLIIIFSVLLILQGVSQLTKCIKTIRGTSK